MKQKASLGWQRWIPKTQAVGMPKNAPPRCARNARRTLIQRHLAGSSTVIERGICKRDVCLAKFLGMHPFHRLHRLRLLDLSFFSPCFYPSNDQFQLIYRKLTFMVARGLDYHDLAVIWIARADSSASITAFQSASIAGEI